MVADRLAKRSTQDIGRMMMIVGFNGAATVKSYLAPMGIGRAHQHIRMWAPLFRLLLAERVELNFSALNAH